MNHCYNNIYVPVCWLEEYQCQEQLWSLKYQLAQWTSVSPEHCLPRSWWSEHHRRILCQERLSWCLVAGWLRLGHLWRKRQGQLWRTLEAGVLWLSLLQCRAPGHWRRLPGGWAPPGQHRTSGIPAPGLSQQPGAGAAASLDCSGWTHCHWRDSHQLCRTEHKMLLVNKVWFY